MKEHPILFNGPMVRALLDGSKTQTRRVVKLTDAAHVKEPRGHRRWHPADPNASIACPYGQPSDRLWVRETWRGIVQINGPHDPYETGVARYIPDQQYCKKVEFAATDKTDYMEPWRPSIHMPRWASRITLEVVSVRAERLQDISEADAIAEGCAKNHNGYYWGGPHKVGGLKQMESATSAYRTIWASINGEGSWDTNPRVWVVEFKRLPA